MNTKSGVDQSTVLAAGMDSSIMTGNLSPYNGRLDVLTWTIGRACMDDLTMLT